MIVSCSNISKFKTYESLVKKRVASTNVQNVAKRNFSEKLPEVYCDRCSKLVIAGSKICKEKKVLPTNEEVAEAIHLDSLHRIFSPCRALVIGVRYTTFEDGTVQSMHWIRE